AYNDLNANGLGLPNASTFYYQVFALNTTAAGCTVANPCRSAASATGIGMTALQSINDLHQTSIAVTCSPACTGSISMTFSLNGSSKYQVYRGTAAGGPYTYLGVQLNNNVNTWTDTGLPLGTTYSYVILPKAG